MVKRNSEVCPTFFTFVWFLYILFSKSQMLFIIWYLGDLQFILFYFIYMKCQKIFTSWIKKNIHIPRYIRFIEINRKIPAGDHFWMFKHHFDLCFEGQLIWRFRLTQQHYLNLKGYLCLKIILCYIPGIVLWINFYFHDLS